MPGSLSHLVRRFFDVLFSRPLALAERAVVEMWLNEKESATFFEQTSYDQRHGYDAALAVVASEFHDTTMIRAALLHDVGKRHARLGPIGRSIASILIGLKTPLSERMALYRDHGPVGARELADLGCEPLVVGFARHHHGMRPTSISLATWNVLQAADLPPKARTKVGL